MSESPPLAVERIRLELRARERSQAWLGRQVGVKDPSLFNRYIRGRQRRPSDLVERIARVLGLDPSELSDDVEAAA